jgi:hypothetical protein
VSQAPAFCFFTERFERYRGAGQATAAIRLMPDSHNAMSETRQARDRALDDVFEAVPLPMRFPEGRGWEVKIQKAPDFTW